MSAPRQYDFEALAETTGTDWNTGRGELNAALKSIREQSEITDAYLLSAEIHERAKMYRQVFPGISLTPTALAKHWKRVFEESRRAPARSNQAASVECETCEGNRFVQVGTRPDGNELWACCPDCNHSDVSFRRYDGSRFVPPDPGRVREMMRS